MRTSALFSVVRESTSRGRRGPPTASNLLKLPLRVIRTVGIHVQIDIGNPTLLAALPRAPSRSAVEQVNVRHLGQRDGAPSAARRQRLRAFAAGLPGQRTFFSIGVPKDDDGEHSRSPFEDARNLLLLDHRPDEELIDRTVHCGILQRPVTACARPPPLPSLPMKHRRHGPG